MQENVVHFIAFLFLIPAVAVYVFYFHIMESSESLFVKFVFLLLIAVLVILGFVPLDIVDQGINSFLETIAPFCEKISSLISQIRS